MRQSLRWSAFVVAVVLAIAACTDDPATDVSGPAEDLDTIELSTSTSTSTSTAPSTTTTAVEDGDADTATTTTAAPVGMCGDLTPVVTAGGTRCIDPDAPVTWDVDPAWFEPVDDSAALPMMIGADWRQVFVVDGSLPHEDQIIPLRLVDGDVTEVRMMSDGSFIVQETYPDGDEEYWPEVWIYHPDGTSDMVPGATQLYDLGWLDGRQVAVVGVVDGTDGAWPIRTFDVDNLEWVHPDLGPHSASEYFVTNIDVASGLMVVTAIADLTEWVRFTTTDGVDAELASPTDSLDYNAPPYITAATFTPDASVVLWAEGPDWDGAAEEQASDPWRIEAVDIATGDQVLGWQVTDLDGPDDLNVVSTHHTGDFVFVNSNTWTSGARVNGQPFIIDLRGEEPEEWRLRFRGIVSPIGSF